MTILCVFMRLFVCVCFNNGTLKNKTKGANSSAFKELILHDFDK